VFSSKTIDSICYNNPLELEIFVSVLVRKRCGCSALSVPEVSIIPLARLEEKKRRFRSCDVHG